MKNLTLPQKYIDDLPLIKDVVMQKLLMIESIDQGFAMITDGDNENFIEVISIKNNPHYSNSQEVYNAIKDAYLNEILDECQNI